MNGDNPYRGWNSFVQHSSFFSFIITLVQKNCLFPAVLQEDSMFLIFFMRNPVAYVVLWVLQMIGYFGILKKLDLDKWLCIIPFAAEKQIGKTEFQTKYAFWHPFILAAFFAAVGLYMDPFTLRIGTQQRLVSLGCLFLAFANYYGYLIRLYWRLGRSFGRGVLFRIGLILFPPLFLSILGYSKIRYKHGTPIRLTPFNKNKFIRRVLVLGSILFFLLETTVSVLAVGYITLQTNVPKPVVYFFLNDMKESAKNVKSDMSQVITREESMGDQYSSFASMKPTRDKFNDSSDDKSAVVMVYLNGSDLEQRMGFASLNVEQMLEGSKNASGMKIVLEAGGSQRWFTNGIPDNSVGRYEISQGQLKSVLPMDTYTCMAEKDALKDFITWTKETYPADRYFLVLWDHGGSLGYGYGVDALNVRKDTPANAMPVNEIVEAIQESGVKFDMVGFDACLMQDVEIAASLEPCADYYLGSEETEPGGGWFYTDAIRALNENPAIPTEEFAGHIVGSYDPYNTAMSEGKQSNTCTLSLLDLTYIKPAYEKLGSLFKTMKEAIPVSENNYADISLSAGQTYHFAMDEQLDLIHYLNNLKAADYDKSVIKDEDADELIRLLNGAIVMRNRSTADGINGIAFAFPYSVLDSYDDIYTQLKALKLSEQEDFYDDYFSIMAVSHAKELESKPKEGLAALIPGKDYTQSEWYRKGFENYVTTVPMIQIPIVQNGDGYSVQLDDNIWKIISDSKQIVYQETEDGLKYLGMDASGRDDENGHPMITSDGTWIFVEGKPAFYEATGSYTDNEKVIFTGISKARLNDDRDIILYIEWDPVGQGDEAPAKGRIIGYDFADNEDAFMAKGHEQFNTGDSFEFVFDYYDEEGNVIDTRPSGGAIRIVNNDTINVRDEPLKNCTIRHGLILTDIYQRKFQTELVETTLN